MSHHCLPSSSSSSHQAQHLGGTALPLNSREPWGEAPKTPNSVHPRLSFNTEDTFSSGAFLTSPTQQSPCSQVPSLGLTSLWQTSQSLELGGLGPKPGSSITCFLCDWGQLLPSLYLGAALTCLVGYDEDSPSSQNSAWHTLTLHTPRSLLHSPRFINGPLFLALFTLRFHYAALIPAAALISFSIHSLLPLPSPIQTPVCVPSVYWSPC